LNYTRAAPGPNQPAARLDIVPERSGCQATTTAYALPGAHDRGTA